MNKMPIAAIQTISKHKILPSIHQIHGSNPSLNHPKCFFSIPNSKTNFSNYSFAISQSPGGRIGAAIDSQSEVNGGVNFDVLLSILEFLSLASSAAISVYIALGSGVHKEGILGFTSSNNFVWLCIVVVSVSVIGAVIRRRQWNRILGARVRGSKSFGAHLSSRVEKLENDLRISATIIRVLSRQLDKLGNRVRITRKALKEPIGESASLAQKNSEATRALAAKDDALEKELGEIHDLLLAMQEQQQKQLELIMAVGKARKLLETPDVRKH